MFLLVPVGDDNPKERTPYVNYALLAANVLFFFITGPQPSDEVLTMWALNPSDFHWSQLFTHMFMHLGWMHIISNMVFLWIFGDNIEDRLGHFGYAFFYLGWGLAAAMLHMATTARPDLPMLGASGAVSGVIGAYIVFFPTRPIRLLFWLLIFVRVFAVKAVYWIGFWFLQQLVLVALDQDGGVAYAAHIGGFVVGAAVATLWRFLIDPPPARSATPVIPAGMLNASRRRLAPTTRARTDLAPPGTAFTSEPDETCAVLLSGSDAAPTPELIEAVAAATGEPVGAVAQRLVATRGVIARNIDAMTADGIAWELKKSGRRTIIVPDSPATRPPFPRSATSAAWSAGGIGLTLEDARLQPTWSDPTLIVAAQWDGHPVIELFIPEVGRVRVGPETLVGEIDPLTGGLVESSLQRFAAGVLRHRRSAWLNEGVRVLAGAGQWGWLAFPSEAEYEDYLFWIYTLIHHQSHAVLK